LKESKRSKKTTISAPKKSKVHLERFLSHISVKDGGNQKVPKIGASNTLEITSCPSPKYCPSRKIYIKLVNTVNTNLEQKSVTSIIPKIITKSTENRFWKNL